MKHLLTLLFILFLCKLFAQKQNNKIINFDSILLHYKKSNKFKEYANLSHDLSLIYFRDSSNFSNALEYAIKEVKFKKYLPQDKQKRSLFNLGFFLFKNKEYSKSIKIYNKVIDSFDIDKYTYNVYSANARNHEALGDYFQAANHYKKGLLNHEKISTIQLPGIYLNNIILNHKIGSKQSIRENDKLFKIIDSLSNVITLSNTNFYSLNHEYGFFYSNDSNYNFNKSKYYYLKNLKRAFAEKNSEIIFKSSNGLGVLYNKEKNDSAFYYINVGLKYAKDSIEISRLYINRAEHLFNTKKVNEALQTLQTAMQLTLHKKIDSAITFTPNFQTLPFSKQKMRTLLTLTEKAKYILISSELSNSNELIETAYNSVMLADKLLDLIRKESTENESKLFWQKKASEIFMLGVKACFKLKKYDKAFYFIEKNKALMLLENIAENKLRTNSIIPVDVLQQEQNIKTKIYDAENELNNTSSKRSKDKYYSIKIEYNNFVESLKNNFPEYYNSKQPIDVEKIESIKNNLDKNTTVLEYILNEDDGFLLAITKNNTQLLELSETKQLETEINDYLKFIHNPLNNIEDKEDYNKIAKKLYNRLFPFKNKNILKNKLLIIPDYSLQNLPFESLRNDNKYLIEDYEISYAYSLSFSNSNKKTKREAQHSFIGFAPDSFNYDNLQTLPRSKTETKTIANKLNGLTLLDTLATKTSFFSKIKDYKIIHLSTHANANDSISPWIAFKNEKLYLNELYTTKNQAELVVLNACKSSIGKISSGEGVFSLARGFFYSGANSVISSLWNVNDKSNAEITINFYRYLKEGKTKSASLRQAKLDYLKTHSLSEVSPYYWSSLILIGDDSPISFENNLVLYFISGIVLLIILFFILKKIKIVGNKS